MSNARALTLTTPGEREIALTRDFAAPRHLVFEAYTRPEQRRFGYYAMPLLWGYGIIGWANVSRKDGRLDADLGFVGARPRDPAFRRGLDAELAAMESFLT